MLTVHERVASGQELVDIPITYREQQPIILDSLENLIDPAEFIERSQAYFNEWQLITDVAFAVGNTPGGQDDPRGTAAEYLKDLHKPETEQDQLLLDQRANQALALIRDSKENNPFEPLEQFMPAVPYAETKTVPFLPEDEVMGVVVSELTDRLARLDALKRLAAPGAAGYWVKPPLTPTEYLQEKQLRQLSSLIHTAENLSHTARGPHKITLPNGEVGLVDARHDPLLPVLAVSAVKHAFNEIVPFVTDYVLDEHDAYGVGGIPVVEVASDLVYGSSYMANILVGPRDKGKQKVTELVTQPDGPETENEMREAMQQRDVHGAALETLQALYGHAAHKLMLRFGDRVDALDRFLSSQSKNTSDLDLRYGSPLFWTGQELLMLRGFMNGLFAPPHLDVDESLRGVMTESQTTVNNYWQQTTTGEFERDLATAHSGRPGMKRHYWRREPGEQR